MKRIEIYLDESGEIGGEGRQMNVTGVVMVSQDGATSDLFHRALYDSVERDGLLAGFCDGGSLRITQTNPPPNYLPKRPQGGGLSEHRNQILSVTGHVNRLANEHGVEIGAFSLVFPSNPKMPWESLTSWENKLLDRSYIERLKDALELLFFECPWMISHLSSPCEVALDLPTRSVSADLPQGPSLKGCGDILWDCWGLKNDGEGRGELRACSLAPGDGAEVLTSVLGRRHDSLPGTVKILGARCVRLMDWDSWQRDCPNANARNTWSQKYLPPKQIHYLADLMANSIYHKNSGSRVHQDGSVAQWFQKGFLLSAGEVDSWILASRMFANGDRVGALGLLFKDRAMINLGEKANFFRKRSKDWFPQLGGADLRKLFEASKLKQIRIKRPQERANTKTSSSLPSTSGNRPDVLDDSTPKKSEPPILDLVAVTREPKSSAASVFVRWRVLLELEASWTSQSLMEAIKAMATLPEPISVRSFAKEEVIEFVLDLRTLEDREAWTAGEILIGEKRVMVVDATIPSSYRANGAMVDTSHSDDAAGA
jgi:hypothetical protein